jgi:dTDP-4-dehydrorhamnose 3,5-epimerase
MDAERLHIPDVVLLRPRRIADDRGFFSETWRRDVTASAGVDVVFVQDNLSYSAKAGTLRGLHYQSPPHAQSKLVGVMTGAVLDVAVDVRRGSPTFGRHVAVELSADNGLQMFIPAGFLHGFLTLTDETRVAYKVSDYYSASCDGAVRWDDPDLAIPWGLDAAMAVLSDKDRRAPAFAEWTSPFAYAPEPA